jgi:hypothetical protein
VAGSQRQTPMRAQQAPSIAGFGGHPTRFSRCQGVARDRVDSYVLSRDSCGIFLVSFPGVLKDGGRARFAGLRTRQGRSTRVRKSSYEVTPSKAERDRGRPADR